MIPNYSGKHDLRAADYIRMRCPNCNHYSHFNIQNRQFLATCMNCNFQTQLEAAQVSIECFGCRKHFLSKDIKLIWDETNCHMEYCNSCAKKEIDEWNLFLNEVSQDD